MNHGAGRQKAQANTQALAAAWIDQWQQEHPDTERIDVPGAQWALPL